MHANSMISIYLTIVKESYIGGTISTNCNIIIIAVYILCGITINI